MAVEYSTTNVSGYKSEPVTRSCFGAYATTAHFHYDKNRTTKIKTINFHISGYYFREGVRNGQDYQKAFCKELKKVLDSFPWMKDVVTLHPHLGVLRAHVRKGPADKVMSSLFLFRNLCNIDAIHSSYVYIRNLGYNAKFSAIVSNLYSLVTDYRKNISFTPRDIGEYNWMNPRTFGENSFIKLMQSKEDTEFNFIQPLFSEIGGYHREEFFSRNDLYNNDHYSPSHEFFNEDNPRYLVDCLSIQGDVPLLKNAEYDYYGKDYDYRHLQLYPRFEETIDEDRFSAILIELENICFLNGVSAKED